MAVLLSSTVAYAAPTATDSCNLEKLGTRAFESTPLAAPVASKLELLGWVMDHTRTAVPFDVSIRFTSQDRNVVVPIRHRVLRPDVVAHFGNENLMLAGFVAILPGSRLGVGTWKIDILYRIKSTEYVCEQGRTITLHGAAP